jgi:two-component system OmpR family sensor kinase
MSGTASTVRKRWVEAAWGLFVAANVAVIVFLPKWEAIPIHLIWLSLVLVYWVRRWPVRPTVVVLAGIFLLTATLQLWTASRLGNGLSEPAEAPLLAFMFGAIVWHTHRRWLAVEDARRLAQAQREFVSDTSHELRTPITIARGHADLIRMACPGEEAAEDADVIIQELNCLSTMSDRLLLLAAAEHPGFLRSAPVDLGLVLAHTAARWRLAARRNWSFNIDLPARLLADQDLLVNAFDALLENAARFTDEDDTITVNARVGRDVAIIEIEDSGIGIAPDDLPRIFDRFFRTGDRSRWNGGTGLGLAIVKAIVEAHDGTISVTSELGIGTAFRICFTGLMPTSTEPAVDIQAPPSTVFAGQASVAKLRGLV